MADEQMTDENDTDASSEENAQQQLLQDFIENATPNPDKRLELLDALEDNYFTSLDDLNSENIDAVFADQEPGITAALHRSLGEIKLRERKKKAEAEKAAAEAAKDKDADKKLSPKELRARLKEEREANRTRATEALQAVKEFTSSGHEMADLSAIKELAQTEHAMVAQSGTTNWDGDDSIDIGEWTSDEIATLLYQSNLDCALHDGAIDDKAFFQRSTEPCLQFLDVDWTEVTRRPETTWEFDSSVFSNTSHRDFYRNTSASFSCSGSYGMFSASMSASMSQAKREINKNSTFSAITKARANLCHINMRGKMELLDSVVEELQTIVNGDGNNAQKTTELSEFCNTYGYFVVTEVLLGVQATGEFNGTASEDFDSGAMAATMSATMSYGSALGNSISASVSGSMEERLKTQVEAMRQNMTIRVTGAPYAVTMNSLYEIGAACEDAKNLYVSEIRTVETIFDLLPDESLKNSIVEILSSGEIEDGFIYKIKCSVGGQYCDNVNNTLVARNNDAGSGKLWLIKAAGPDVYTIHRANQPTLGWWVAKRVGTETPPVQTNKAFAGDNSKFLLVKAPEKPGWYKIIPSDVQDSEGYCLDVPQANGTLVMRRFPNDIEPTTCYFKLEAQGSPDEGRKVNIVMTADSQWIAAPNVARDRVTLSTLKQTRWKEQWIMLDAGNGFYTFMDPVSGQVVDTANHNNGTRLSMNPWNAGRSQQKWWPRDGMINVSGDGDARWDGAESGNRRQGAEIWQWNGGWHENRGWMIATRDEMDPAPSKLYQIFQGANMLLANGKMAANRYGSHYKNDLYSIAWVEGRGNNQGWSIANKDGKLLTVNRSAVNGPLTFQPPQAGGEPAITQLFQYVYNATSRSYQLKALVGPDAAKAKVCVYRVGTQLRLARAPQSGHNFIIFELWPGEK